MRASERQTAEGLLFTDMYQLTMAQVYHHHGIHEQRAQFDHFFRSYPDYGGHQAGYCIAAGLEWLLDWMDEVRVREADLAHLRAARGRGGEPLFDTRFLEWLGEHGSFASIDLRAVPEGRVVHANAPMTIVQGPLAMAQILESSLLAHLNYQTLVATKAARIHRSGAGRPLIDFGLRRAHEKGANAGARAALVGGAAATSNTGVSYAMGRSPKGTHAHSMVQAFMALGGSERDAFRAYADVYPDDCLLLVDTVNTLESGVPNAIRVFEELRRKGHEPVGVRLDSGDLAHLAVRTAAMLDAAGFEKTTIVLSNQIDEQVLVQILSQIREEAPRYDVDADALVGRLVYGVGTRLITSAGQSALDGVYKLVAMREADEWMPAIKVSETPAKVPTPGDKRLWRLYDGRGKAVDDLVSLADETPEEMTEIVACHPVEPDTCRRFGREELSAIEPMLVEVLREGRAVTAPPSLEEIGEARDRDIERLDSGVRRNVNPHRYHVSLTERLRDLKRELVAEARRGRRAAHGC